MQPLAAHLESARAQLATLAHGALKLERDSGTLIRVKTLGEGLGGKAGGKV